MRRQLFAIVKALTLNYHFQRNKKNSLLILMFHQVNDDRTRFYSGMPVKAFGDICEFIKTYYDVIHVSEIASHFQNTNKPAAIITFDDGHYDIVQNALPILLKLGLKFEVNIDTEIIETGKPQDFVRVWNILNQVYLEKFINPKFMSKPILINKSNPSKTEMEFTNTMSVLNFQKKREFSDEMAAMVGKQRVKYSRMLSEKDIKLLSNQNVEFGSHSHTHSILTNLDKEHLNYELTHSKEILESIIQKNIEILAYPNGVFNEEVEKTANNIGFKYLLKTEDKINIIDQSNLSSANYFRVNQYHQTPEEALAHTYGIINLIKKITK